MRSIASALIWKYSSCIAQRVKIEGILLPIEIDKVKGENGRVSGGDKLGIGNQQDASCMAFHTKEHILETFSHTDSHTVKGIHV
jgi:hypothetical protein